MTVQNIAIRVAFEGGDKAERDMKQLGDSGERAIKKIHDATKPTGDGLKILNGIMHEVKGGFEEFAEHGGAISRILSGINPAGLAAAAGIGAIVFEIHNAIEAAEEFNQAQRRLEALLRATGGTVGLTQKELTEFAEEMEHTTLLTSENVQQVEAVLLTFRHIHGDTFKEATKLTADLSDVFQKDFTSAARTLGQALDDPVNGLDKLARANVRLSESQKEEIKTLAQSGQIHEAQAKILEYLESKLGGTAAAQNQGVTGATKHFKDALDELNRAIGLNIEDSKTYENILNGLTSVFEKMRMHVRPLAEEELADLNKRMQLMQSAGTNTLFGLVENPFYNKLKEQRGELEAEIAKDTADKTAARDKARRDEAQTRAEELLAIEKDLNKKIREETQTERDKIIAESETFKQRIRGQLQDDSSNKADVEKRLALADKLKKIELDKINQKEAEEANRLAEANNKVVESLQKRLRVEQLKQKQDGGRSSFVQGELDKLNPNASSKNHQEVKALADQMFDQQQMQKAADAHEKAIKKINDEILKTKPSFEQAKLSLDEWKDGLIKDLGGTTQENQKYIELIEQIYTVRLKEIYDKSQLDSDKWADGAARGLKKYSDEVSNAAKNSERVFSNAANKIEDSLVDIVSSGEFNMKKLGSLVTSIEQDIMRSFIRENITGPISSGLSSFLGGGSSGGGIFGSLFSSIFHEGGVVGETMTSNRSLPAFAFAGAPRFHNGLMPDEFPAILQKGETVIPRNKKVGGMNVTFNISTPNAQSFIDSKGQIMSKFASEMQRHNARNG
ncbi:MAG: phage tail length tape measure family protein [Alphaproteobacteria bacterium]|nr:phage tail length tape measure family protein [Alphaproteobacteria bacterium]